MVGTLFLSVKLGSQNSNQGSLENISIFYAQILHALYPTQKLTESSLPVENITKHFFSSFHPKVQRILRTKSYLNFINPHTSFASYLAL